MIRKIEIERCSLTSSSPFDQVVAAVNASIGHPDMAEFGRSTHEARSFTELKSAVEKGLSKAGLMLFMLLDQGAVVRKETGQDRPRILLCLSKISKCLSVWELLSLPKTRSRKKQVKYGSRGERITRVLRP